MSLVQWGPDTIRLGRVLNYRVTNLMTEDGIDYLSTRYDVDFQGIVSLDLGSDAVAAAKIMQARMLQPRKAFRLYVGSLESPNPILESSAPDRRGGPHCTSVSFSQFSGTRTAICNASFTIHQHDCGTSTPTILTNRWSTNSVLDQDYYTRMTITGELQINPFARFGADAVRDACFRQVPQGMQPVHASFVQSTDGLKLNYSIVFQEKYQLPPGVATDIKCEYTETSQNGAMVIGECSCDVTGPKTATKAALFGIAMSVVNSRFNFGAFNGQPGFDIFSGGVVREVMHDNRVSVVLRGIKTQAAQLQGVGPLRVDPNVFGKAIPFAPAGKGEQIPVWGNAGANGGYKAVAAAWKALVCADATPTSQNEVANLSYTGDSTIPGLTYQISDLPPPDTSLDKYSPGQRQYPYIQGGHRHHGFQNPWGSDTHIDTNLFQNPGLYLIPLAKKGAPLSSMDGVDGGQKHKHVAVVRLHQPLAHKEFTYHLIRVGAKPEIPIVSLKPGVTLLWNRMGICAPRMAADGVTPIYEAYGKISVGFHSNIDVETDSIRFAVSPETKYDITNEGTYDPGNFETKWVEGN